MRPDSDERVIPEIPDTLQLRRSILANRPMSKATVLVINYPSIPLTTLDHMRL